MDIKSVLKQYKFKKSEIDTIMKNYQYAIDNKILYPLYYAISKILN